jgi:integrase
VLRKLLSTAVEWRLLSVVPPIKWLRAPPGEFDFLTFEEADRLIAGAEDDWRAMITVALRTGLRHGELIGLRWVDVDLDAGRVVVRQAVSEGVIDTPKNGRTREVPLCKQALDALREHPRKGPLVFCAPDGSACRRNTTSVAFGDRCGMCRRRGGVAGGVHSGRGSRGSNDRQADLPLVTREFTRHSRGIKKFRCVRI